MLILLLSLFAGNGLYAEFLVPNAKDLTFKKLAEIQAERTKLFPQTLEALKSGSLYSNLKKISEKEKSAWQKFRTFLAVDQQTAQIEYINKSQADIIARVQAYQNYKDKPDKETMSNHEYFTEYANALESMQESVLAKAIAELRTYLAFEDKLQPLHDYFSNRDVAATLIVDRIKRKVGFSDWLDDYLKYGPNFPVLETKDSIISFYKSALNTFNTITRNNQNDENILKHSDSGYRTVILRLQVIDPTKKLNGLVEQRQLAKNGMTSIKEAYIKLAKTLKCAVTDLLTKTSCSNANGEGLFALMKSIPAWMEQNPLEAEVLVKELDHAYSILTSKGNTVTGLLLESASNILNRRLSADFLKGAIFGTYDRKVDLKSKLQPELIAIVSMAPALPYLASAVNSFTGQTSLIANIGGAALTLANPGLVVPTSLALFVKTVAGLVQVKLEKKASEMLTSNSEAAALMKGMLSLAQGKGLNAALSSAATLYFARQGVELFGTIATDWRESSWVKVAEGAGLLGAGVYAYCTGDISAVTTFGAMLCGHHYVYQNPCVKQKFCERIQNEIKTIAENMQIDAKTLEKNIHDAALSEGKAKTDYNTLVDGLAKTLPGTGDSRKVVEDSFAALFSEQKALFGGLEVLKLMSGVRQ